MDTPQNKKPPGQHSPLTNDQNTEKLTSLAQKLRAQKSHFSNYNMVRMREALRYLTGPRLSLFINIPFYLHVNLKAYPGYVDSGPPAHGIYDFQTSGFFKEGLKTGIIRETDIPDNPDPCVLGLYHIGSLGTFTQSLGSDFDYWIIIDKTRFTEARYGNLRNKLDQIIKFSRESCGQKVSFFIMDQEDIRNNCYAGFNTPETLIVPKLFLKEEFYRTFLMIAGKLPLWTILPPRGNRQTYETLARGVIHPEKFEPLGLEDFFQEFIDLGYLALPGPEELLKGLLWHICKSKADPVKALIKATMIFSQGFDGKRAKELLCHEIKAGYAKAGIDDFKVDPYRILFDRILSFHVKQDPVNLNLIKNAIFFRLCGYPMVKFPEEGSPKKQLLDRYIRNWNLTPPQVNKLLSHGEWSEPEKLLLEQTIINRLSQMLQEASSLHPPEKIFKELNLPEKRNFNILMHKTRERLNHARGKIPECSTFLRRQKFSLLLCRQKRGSSWFLSGVLSGSKNQGREINLYKSEGLLGLLGWALENQLYNRYESRLKIDCETQLFESSDTPVSPDRICCNLLPVKPLGDDIFEHDPAWSKLMILLFQGEKGPVKVDFLALNTWGELFSDTFDLDREKNLGDRYRGIAQKINKYTGEDLRFFFFQLGNQRNPDAVFEIRQHMAAGFPGKIPGLSDRNRPLLDKL